MALHLLHLRTFLPVTQVLEDLPDAHSFCAVHALHLMVSAYVEPEHCPSKYLPIGQLVLHLVQPN